MAIGADSRPLLHVLNSFSTFARRSFLVAFDAELRVGVSAEAEEDFTPFHFPTQSFWPSDGPESSA